MPGEEAPATPKGVELPRDPWITADGYFDPTKFPIDGTLRQAVSGDREKLRNAACMLESMACRGRREAGVFLLGLLADLPPDAFEDRRHVVEALRHFETESSAAALFGEIRRVKSSNATRRYLDAVIKALRMMPPRLVQEGLEALADDTTFSYGMRAKFREAAEYVCWEECQRVALREGLEASDETGGDE